MDVLMPDGTTITGVPEGITQSELLARYNKFSTMQATPQAAPAQPTPNAMTGSEYLSQVAQRKEQAPERTIGGTAIDAGVTLLKGAIGLPEAVVGLADIPTMGYAGKLLEQAGFKPKEAKEVLDTYLSEAQQAANRKVRETKGFLPTIGAALQNPSTIATAVGESLPQMLGGAGIARGILQAAPKVGAVVAGAAGEGLLGVGSAAEQIRQEAADKLLTGKQVISAVGSGVGTAAFGVAGGKLAKKLGIDDIDTLLAGGAGQTGSKSVKDFAKRATASGISEGAFEEMPQSAQEQMWMNYATDKPLFQGVPEAAGMGLVTGATMGVGATAAGGRWKEAPITPPLKTEEEAALVKATTPAAPISSEVAPPSASQDTDAMLRELTGDIPAGISDLTEILQEPVAETPATVKVYRGHRIGEEFKSADDGNIGAGYYTTESEEAAKEFASRNENGTVLQGELIASRILDMDKLSKEDIANLKRAIPKTAQELQEYGIPYYDDVTNELVTEDLQKIHSNLNRGGFEPRKLSDALPQGYTEALGAIYNKAGYDAITRTGDALKSGTKYKEYVTFSPESQKLLTPKAPTTTPETREEYPTLSKTEVEELGLAPKPRVEKPKEPKIDYLNHPENVGSDASSKREFDNKGKLQVAPQNIADGGTPFKSRAAADTARKNYPDMRVLPTADKKGFILAPKTPKQIEADKAKAKRLGLPMTTTKGTPMAAHQFITSEGGITKNAMKDLGMDENVRSGNRSLFTDTGMSVEQAYMKLQEAGYLEEGATQNDARNLITESVKKPKYRQQDTEEMTKRAAQADYEDYLKAEEEASMYSPVDEEMGYEMGDFEGTGYEGASPEIQAEVRALLAQADALGINTESIKEEIFYETENQSVQAYYKAFKSALEDAITASRQDRIEDTGQPSGEGAGFELTAPTADEVRARQAEAEGRAKEDERAKKAAEDKAKADEQAAEFTLTGSDREADVAAARGQRDIFAEAPAEAPAESPKPQTEQERTVTLTKKEFREDMETRGKSDHKALKMVFKGETPKSLIAKYGEKDVRFLGRLFDIDVKDKFNVAKKLIAIDNGLSLIRGKDKAYFDKMNKAQLGEFLEAVGQSAYGQKYQLVERLLKHEGNVMGKFNDNLQDLKHKAAILNEARAGKPISEEILKDYPDVAAFTLPRNSDGYKNAIRGLAIKNLPSLGMDTPSVIESFRNDAKASKDSLEKNVANDIADYMESYYKNQQEKSNQTMAKLGSGTGPTMSEMIAENKRVKAELAALEKAEKGPLTEAEKEAAAEAEEEAIRNKAEAEIDEGPIGQAIAKIENGDIETKAQIRSFVNKLERDGVLDDVEDVREGLSDREQDASEVLDTLNGLLDDARDNAIDERFDELLEEGAQEELTQEPPDLQPALGTIEKQTETPAFKKFFGDSKVVDADGNPMVVYHGTIVRPDTDTVKNMGDIQAFDRMFTTKFRRPSIDIMGSWFSTNPGKDGAELYSGAAEGSAIYPVYLSIKNPHVTTFQMMQRRARLLENGKDDGRAIGQAEVDAYRKWLASMGKDGIKIEGSGNKGSTEFDNQVAWIALEPEQIKSATGNIGTFDESPNIAFSLGNIENLAKQYNGKIVFGDDNMGLVLAYGERTGEPLYVPYVGDAMFRNDIEQFPAKSFKLSDADYQKLVDAKRDLEQAAIEKHEKTPFLKMGEGVTGSKGIPGNVLSVTKGWAKMLNLTGNIHIMTDEEALRDKDKFTGPHRAIGYIGFLGEPGMVKKTGPNEYIVVVRKSTSTGKTLEVLAHELGHIHQGQTFEKADADTKNAVIREFNKWFEKSKTGTAGELVNSMRAKRMARATKGDKDIPALEMQKRQYWFSFGEWYADQTSRWATTNAKPVGVVEQFFSRLGKAIRNFFGQAQAAKYLPNETFAEYLEKVSSVTDLTEPTDVFTGDQIPLFAFEDIGGKAPPSTPRRNYEGNPAPEPAFESPEESKMDTLIYKLQDKLIDTKRVMEEITKTSGEIAENWDVYKKEETYHGRLAKRTEDFLDDELMPIFKEMKEKGVSLDDLENYLQNRHAEEANEYIAKINPERPDGGSGIKTAKAREYLANLTQEQRDTYDSLAKKIDTIIKGTQKLLVDTGLEKKEVIDNWNKAYEHYVPLERDNLDFVQSGRGVMGGFSTRGSASKRRVGSEKDVINIFANIALQRERAIRRSEQARVGRALYGMAIKYPNPDFWLPINPDAIKDKEKLVAELKGMGLSDADAENIIQEPKEPQFDKKTGMVRYQINPLLRNSPNVFPVRINGEDRFIIFNPNDPRAKRMVESLKNLDAEQLGTVLGTIGMATRWIASVNTQYNPVFGAWNFLRDVQGAALNLSTTELAGREKEVLKSTWPALFAVYRDLRGKEGKTEKSKEWIAMFERYQLAGGQTGYQNQFSETRQKANVVEREIARLEHGTARKAAESVFQWLSDYNDSMENAVRLSAFKVAVTPKAEGGLGMSDDAAASLAKNLTVNFNRKGASSPILQSLYAFFNAAVQGNARLLKTLRGPAGKKIIVGGMTIGAFQAIALAMAGFDDDEPPDFVKDKNLVIPVGDGKYLTIPMPLGFNVFPGLGRLAMETMLIGTGNMRSRKGVTSKFGSAASLIVDSFNPLGSGSVQQLLTPTVADPLMALYANRDAFGRPISKEDRATSPTPGYERSRENASIFSQKLAEALNWLTSPPGSKHTKGWASPTADQIDYIIGQYTGGVGREIMKVGETAKSFVTKEEQPIYRIPVVGRLYGETGTPAAISSKFYGNVTAMAEHEHEIKGRQKAKESVVEYYKENPEARLWQRANYIENQIAKLNKEKKALREKGAPDEQIKRKEDQKIALMKAFNEQVKKLQ